MSVMLLGLDLYQEVFNKACGYKYNKTVDINYCGALAMEDYSVRWWLANLYELNALSYYNRYREKIDTDHIRVAKEAIKDWHWEEIKKPKCNTYQMLKHLQCIGYQIEFASLSEVNLATEEHKRAYDILCKATLELQDRIINTIPEYKGAKWGCV